MVCDHSNKNRDHKFKIFLLESGRIAHLLQNIKASRVSRRGVDALNLSLRYWLCDVSRVNALRCMPFVKCN